MKTKNLLIYDKSNKAWHIAEGTHPCGEFTACGVAHEELMEWNNCLYGVDDIPEKQGGLVTCEECIDAVIRAKLIVDSCKFGKKDIEEYNKQKKAENTGEES